MGKQMISKDDLVGQLTELSIQLGEVRGVLLLPDAFEPYLTNQLDNESHAYSDYVLFTEYCRDQQALLNKYLDIGDKLKALKEAIEHYEKDNRVRTLYFQLVLAHDDRERSVISSTVNSPLNYGYNEVGQHFKPLADDLEQKRRAYLRADRLQGMVERLANPVLKQLIQYNQVYLPQFYPSADDPDQLVEFRLQALDEVNAITLGSYDEPQELITQLAGYGLHINMRQANSIRLAAASAEAKLDEALELIVNILTQTRALSAEMRSIDPTAEQHVILEKLSNLGRIKNEHADLIDDLEVLMGELVDLKDLIFTNVDLKEKYHSLNHKIYRENGLYQRVLQRIDMACAPLLEAERQAVQPLLEAQQARARSVSATIQLDISGTDIAKLLSAVDKELDQSYWEIYSPELQTIEDSVEAIKNVVTSGGELRQQLDALAETINTCRGENAQDYDRLITLRQRLLSNPIHQVNFSDPQKAKIYQNLQAFHQGFIRGDVIVADVYEYLGQPEVYSFIKKAPQALHLVRAIQSCIVEHSLQLLKFDHATSFIEAEIASIKNYKLQIRQIERWIWVAQRCYEQGDNTSLALLINTLRSEKLFGIVHNSEAGLTPQVKAIHTRLRAVVDVEEGNLSRDSIPPLRERLFEHEVTETLPLAYDLVVRAMLNPVVKALLTDFRFVQQLDASRADLNDLIRRLNETSAKQYEQPQDELQELFEILSELNLGFTYGQLAYMQIANRKLYAERSIKQEFDERFSSLTNRKDSLLDDYVDTNLPSRLTADLEQWSNIFKKIETMKTRSEHLYAEIETLQKDLQRAKAGLINATDAVSKAQIIAIDGYLKAVELLLIPVGQVKNDVNDTVSKGVNTSAQQFIQELKDLKLFVQSFPERIALLNAQADDLVKLQQKLHTQGKELSDENQQLLTLVRYSIDELSRDLQQAITQSANYMLHLRKGSLSEEISQVVLEAIGLHRELQRLLISEKLLGYKRELFLCEDKLTAMQRSIDAKSSQTGQVLQWVTECDLQRSIGGEQWVQKSDGRNEFPTSILTSEDSDLTGTNGQLEVREFTTESYYGLMTEDFLQRLLSAHQALLTLIPEDMTERDIVLAWIKQQYEAVYEQIEIECYVEPLVKDEKLPALIKLAETKINQYLINVLNVIEPNTPSKQALEKVRSAESNAIADADRANVLHIYQVNKFNDYGASIRFSAFQSLGEGTLPSTARTLPKLANFAQRSCGYRDAKTNEWKVQFVGLTHSSYPLIGLSNDTLADKVQRRHGAALAVEELILELAKQQLVGKNPEDYADTPLVISMSTMALFSPIPQDKQVMGADSEQRQLKETQLALQMFQHRTLERELTIEGRTYTVNIQPDITLMNAPLNGLSAATKLSSLQDQINLKGFNEFAGHVATYITEHLDTEIEFESAQQRESVRKIANLWGKVAALSPDEVSLQATIGTLNTKLEAEYHRLYEIQKQLAEPTDDADLSQLKAEYESTYKLIKAQEDALAKQTKQLFKLKKATHKKQQATLAELYNEVCNFIQYSNNASWAATDAGQQLKEIYQIIQLYLDCQNLYFSGKLTSKKHLHEFQTRYALLNYKIGRYLDAFCKSAEDRTGRLFNRIEEFCAFERDFGFYPRFGNEKDLEKLDDIARTVLEFSTARELAGKNVPGARGLQQSDKLRVNQALSVKTDKKAATMAKGIYSVNPKIKPAHNYPFERICLVINAYLESESSPDLFKLDALFSELKVMLATKPQLAQERQVWKLKEQLAAKYPSMQVVEQAVATMNHYFSALQKDISKDELLKTSGSSETPNLTAYVKGCDNLSLHVARSILSLTDVDLRVMKVEYWLQVANQCLVSGNYAAASLIFGGGIKNCGIYLDELLMSGISDEAKMIFAKLEGERHKAALLYNYEHENRPIIPFISTLTGMLAPLAAKLKGAAFEESHVTTRMVTILQDSQQQAERFSSSAVSFDQDMLTAIAKEGDTEAEFFGIIDELTALRVQYQAEEISPTVSLDNLFAETIDLTAITEKYQTVYREIDASYQEHQLLIANISDIEALVASLDARVSTLPARRSLVTQQQRSAYEDCLPEITRVMSLLSKTLSKLSPGIYANFDRLDEIMTLLQQFGLMDKYTEALKPFSDIHAKFSHLNRIYRKGAFHEKMTAFHRYVSEQLSRFGELKEKMQESLARADEQSVTKPQQRIQLLESLRKPQYAADIVVSLTKFHDSLVTESQLLTAEAAALEQMTVRSDLVAANIAVLRYDAHSERVELCLQENSIALERVAKLLLVYSADDFYGHELAAYLDTLESTDPLLSERRQLVENLSRIQADLEGQRAKLVALQERVGAADAPTASDMLVLQLGFHNQALAAFKAAKYKLNNFVPTALLKQAPESLTQEDIYKLQAVQNQLLAIKQITLPMMEFAPEQLKLTAKQTTKLSALKPLLEDNVQQGAFVKLYRLLNANINNRVENLESSLKQLLAKQQELQQKLAAVGNDADLQSCVQLERELHQDYSILQEQLPQLQKALHQQLSTAQQMQFADDVISLKQYVSKLDSAAEKLNQTVQSRKDLSATLQQKQGEIKQLQGLIQERIQQFLNPAIRALFANNSTLASQLASDSFTPVRVIMMNNVPLRSKPDIQQQFSGMGIDELSEQDMQAVLDGQVYVDRVWKLQNSHLRNLILSSPEKTDLSQLRAGDLELLNNPGQVSAAIRLLQQRGIIQLDEAMQASVRMGYQRLALSRLFTNRVIRDLVANAENFQLPGGINQLDINRLNSATVTTMDDTEFKALLFKIIGNEARLQSNPQLSFLAEDAPTSLDKIMIENRRLIVLNNLKLPVLRQYLVDHDKMALHSRDNSTLSEKTQLAIDTLNNLRAYPEMEMSTFQRHLSEVLDVTISDLSLFRDCKQQASVIMAMPKWVVEQSYHQATIQSLTEASGQYLSQWTRVKTLAQHTGVTSVFKGSNVIDKIYALSSSLYKLDSLARELHASQDNIQDLYQQLVKQQKYFADDLSEQEVEQLAIELKLDSKQVLRNRRHHLDSIARELEKLAKVSREQGQQLDYYQTSMRGLYTELMKETAGIAQYFGETMSSKRSRSASLLSRSQMAHLRDMSAEDKAQHYASLASILLPCLRYLNNEQYKQQFAWNLPAEELAKLQQLLVIIEQKASTKKVAQVDQKYSPGHAATRVHSSPLLSRVVPQSLKATQQSAITVGEGHNKPVRKGSAAVLLDHPDFITTFDSLSDKYKEFELDINRKARSVKYFSKQKALDFSQRRHQPLFSRERRFIFDTISALISQRSDEDLYDAVVLGGKDQVLVNQAYAIVKALDLRVQFDSGVMVFEDDDIRRMIAEFKCIKEVKEFKSLLYPETPTEADLSLDNGVHQPPVVPVVAS